MLESKQHDEKQTGDKHQLVKTPSHSLYIDYQNKKKIFQWTLSHSGAYGASRENAKNQKPASSIAECKLISVGLSSLLVNIKLLIITKSFLKFLNS
jgi:hypothetical protein